MSGKLQPYFSSLSPLTRPPDCRTEVPGAETAVGGDEHGQADQAVVIGPKGPHGSQAVGWGGVGGGRQRAGKQEGAGWKEKPALASRICGELHPIVHGPRDPPDEGCAREAGQGPGDFLPRSLTSGPGEYSSRAAPTVHSSSPQTLI